MNDFQFDFGGFWYCVSRRGVVYMYRGTLVESMTLRTVAGSCSLYLRSKFSEASVLIATAYT